MRRGFSLVEVILCMALAGVLLGSMALNLRGPRYKSQSQGAAEVIAQEFRTAQQTARTSRMPVAIAFPSQGGSQPCAQSYSLLMGFEKPQIVRSRQFHGEFPQARIFNGYWPLDPSALLNSGSGLTAGNPRLGSVYDNSDFSTWNTSAPKDFTLIFMPDGSVRSNGMPQFDGAYHVLVCTEVAYGGAASPAGAPANGISYFSPNTVASPYTVVVGAMGSVQVETGLTAVSSGSVAVVEAASEFQGPGPQAPTLDISTPAVASLEILPTPIVGSLPSGTSAAVGPNGYLTLVTYATDAQGGPLYCSWSGSGGQFSAAGNVSMDWVESIQRWRSSTQWTPPPNPPSNAKYDIGVRVEDRAGHAATAALGSTGKVGVAQGGSIVYSSERGNEMEICSVRPDGSRAQRYYHNIDLEYSWDTNPVLSPDGTKIAFTSDRTGDTEVFVMNSDGTGLINVSNDPAEDTAPITWSPDGSRICWATDRYPSSDWAVNLVCARADGSGLVALTHEVIGNECERPAWSPDGTKIAYEKWDYDNTFNDQIFCMTLNTGGGTVSVTSNVLISNNNNPSVWANADGPPTWNPNSTVVAWTDDRDYNNDPNWNTGVAVYKGHVDGSGIVRLTNTDSTKDCGIPSWSPDGSKICYQVMDWDTFQTDLYKMNPDGSGKSAITNDPYLDVLFSTFGCFMSGVPVAWSPDSSEVSFLSYVNGASNLYRCHLNGAGLLQITQNDMNDSAGPDTPHFSWGDK